MAANKTIVRYPCSSLFELYYAGDCVRDALPVGRLLFELLPPQSRQRIDLGATIVFTRLPLSPNPTAMFQLVQCRVKRTIADAQHVARNLFQTLTDGPSTQGFEPEYFEDQHVQRPLEQVGRLTHAVSSRLPSQTKPAPLG